MPARLITLERHLNVVLDDLSEGGASLTLPVPHPFTVCVLKWMDYHAFAEVRWVRDRSIGLQFAKPIPTATLEHTILHAPDRVTQLKRNLAEPRGC